MRPILISSIILFLLTPQASAEIAKTSPQPGVYISEGGDGVLKIAPHKPSARSDACAENGEDFPKIEKEKLDFSIETDGLYHQTCTLEGTIQDGTATLETYHEDQDGICTVTFQQNDGSVKVDSSYGCRHFCGTSTSFDRIYLPSAPGCSPVQLHKTRDAFKKLYDRKDYARARKTLEPVLTQCKKTLNELEEEGPIRNDLAVTYHKLGDQAACRNVLAPYADDAAKKDEDMDVRTRFSVPSAYFAILAAVRVNLALCDKTEKAARSTVK